MVQVKLIQSNGIFDLEKDINVLLSELSQNGHMDDDLSVQYNLSPRNSLIMATAMIVCKNVVAGDYE